MSVDAHCDGVAFMHVTIPTTVIGPLQAMAASFTEHFIEPLMSSHHVERIDRHVREFLTSQTGEAQKIMNQGLSESISHQGSSQGSLRQNDDATSMWILDSVSHLTALLSGVFSALMELFSELWEAFSVPDLLLAIVEKLMSFHETLTDVAVVIASFLSVCLRETTAPFIVESVAVFFSFVPWAFALLGFLGVFVLAPKRRQTGTTRRQGAKEKMTSREGKSDSENGRESSQLNSKRSGSGVPAGGTLRQQMLHSIAFLIVECVGLNEFTLKKVVRQPRPEGSCLSSNGMPSTHSVLCGAGIVVFGFFWSHFNSHVQQSKRRLRTLNSKSKPQQAESKSDATKKNRESKTCSGDVALRGSATTKQEFLEGTVEEAVAAGEMKIEQVLIETAKVRTLRSLRWTCLVWVVLMLPVPWSRVMLSDHSVEQVLAGALFGTGLGFAHVLVVDPWVKGSWLRGQPTV